ncbi:MAG: hypothetical protein ACRDZ9_09420 [Acidimicrobiales bacterium]
MAEPVTDPEGDDPRAGPARGEVTAGASTGPAWLTVLVLGALAALTIAILAFGNSNTPQSITGRTATTSSGLQP